jgi:hypothetical protein
MFGKLNLQTKNALYGYKKCGNTIIFEKLLSHLKFMIMGVQRWLSQEDRKLFSSSYRYNIPVSDLHLALYKCVSKLSPCRSNFLLSRDSWDILISVILSIPPLYYPHNSLVESRRVK